MSSKALRTRIAILLNEQPILSSQQSPSASYAEPRKTKSRRPEVETGRPAGEHMSAHPPHASRSPSATLYNTGEGRGGGVPRACECLNCNSPMSLRTVAHRNMSTTRLYRYYRRKTNSYRVENFYQYIANDKISPIPSAYHRRVTWLHMLMWPYQSYLLPLCWATFAVTKLLTRCRETKIDRERLWLLA